ncbi:IclR family transcriptional regulator [Sphingomonas sp.]|uniref:IclR family transcriptional regulator n=1 Tax=Sphingomonas sp. TaxID=28214 RepID=UPI001EB5C3C3|nr:IclR family transcriptional regulator [Sphingomonas sp.]MBX3593776.1 IclR family transcriptional regulator [Sphingomonas sp.]
MAKAAKPRYCRIERRGFEQVARGNGGENDAADRNGIQVIARAASILRELNTARDGLSLAELASRLGLARSTVQRIVKALSDEQLLTPTSRHARVRLGPLLVLLGANAKLDVIELVRPIMQKLSAKLGETVDLSVLQGTSALFVDQVTGNNRLSAVSKPGQLFPLHSTANGKALLASVEGDEWRALLPARLPTDTENTITSIDSLESEIDEIRKRRLAFDLEEHTLGVCAIGAWFADPTGRSYAISVPVPSVRFADTLDLRNAVLAAQREIAAAMHSSDPTP